MIAVPAAVIGAPAASAATARVPAPATQTNWPQFRYGASHTADNTAETTLGTGKRRQAQAGSKQMFAFALP